MMIMMSMMVMLMMVMMMSHDRVVSLVDGDGGGDKDQQHGDGGMEERRVRFSPIVENLQERRRSVTKGRS